MPDAIEDLDRQLIELLQRRIQVSRQLGDDEIAPVLDTKYVERLRADPPGKDHAAASAVANWLRHAASICQQSGTSRRPISYLGPIYSYSYLAAARQFGLAAELVPVATIAAVFEEIARSHAAFGVVPIENSTDGRVVDTLGMFAKTEVKICGEVLFPIHHCLLGKCSRSEITEIQSKPQALSQCRGWLAAHVPNARLVEVSSTATAAKTAATTRGVAAIASREAGIHNNLDVIDANIEDVQGNTTRFAVIGNAKSHPTGNDKTSLMFQLNHRPGALASAMQIFQSAGLNLTWIESFPLPNCPNEYLFFVELDGHRAEKSVGNAIRGLDEQALRLEVLGSYPKGHVEE
ncbi:MAG: prephenate dehydratase [Aureliella sp.]